MYTKIGNVHFPMHVVTITHVMSQYHNLPIKSASGNKLVIRTITALINPCSQVVNTAECCLVADVGLCLISDVVGVGICGLLDK